MMRDCALKLVGQRWRPRTLVLEPNPDGSGNGGHLWWYSPAEGAEFPKGSVPLETISAVYNSALSGAAVLGRDGKEIQVLVL